jgi:hypothetical protein
MLDRYLKFCSGSGWVGFDLDGTLAQDDAGGVFNPYFVGEPIPQTVYLMRTFQEAGIKTKIFTARMHVNDPEAKQKRIKVIQDWCEKQGLGRPEVTNVKDTAMRLLFDDRAFHVVRNTGEVIS